MVVDSSPGPTQLSSCDPHETKPDKNSSKHGKGITKSHPSLRSDGHWGRKKNERDAAPDISTHVPAVLNSMGF